MKKWLKELGWSWWWFLTFGVLFSSIPIINTLDLSNTNTIKLSIFAYIFIIYVAGFIYGRYGCNEK